MWIYSHRKKKDPNAVLFLAHHRLSGTHRLERKEKKGREKARM
jgi:hypothetical protein